MNLPDKPQPTSYDSLTIQRSASVFRKTLASILAEESPFADAPFVAQIAEKYLGDKNQLGYFTTNEGLVQILLLWTG